MIMVNWEKPATTYSSSQTPLSSNKTAGLWGEWLHIHIKWSAPLPMENPELLCKNKNGFQGVWQALGDIF